MITLSRRREPYAWKSIKILINLWLSHSGVQPIILLLYPFKETGELPNSSLYIAVWSLMSHDTKTQLCYTKVANYLLSLSANLHCPHAGLSAHF